MALEVIMPRVDMDMTEGKIAYWYVKNGDAVRKGQALFDIETDKATMEVEAEGDGIIQGISSELGVPVPVGQPVAWLLAEGEALPSSAVTEESVDPQPAADNGDANAAPSEAPAEACSNEVPSLPADAAAGCAASRSAFRATPLARSTARQQGIDLTRVAGSGPNGRILARDVSAHSQTSPQPSAAVHLHWLARHGGEPVVFLHGFAAEHGSWRPLATRLAGMPLVGVDLPNHGKSARTAVQCFADLAQPVVRRLDQEGIAGLHLVAHSLGAGVALAMSAQLGPRLRSLTLLAPAGLGPHINGEFIAGLCRASSESSLRAWLGELVHEDRWLTGSFVATAWQQLERPERRAALMALAEAMLPDGTQVEFVRPLLDTLTAPVKVIWGKKDRIIPASHGAGLPGHVALHLLPGVGHLPHIEAADVVAALVAQQHRAGGTA